MALAYQPPGVTTEETVSPQVAPLLAVPASICLVGLSQGFQTKTDQFALSGTTATPLPGLPVGASVSAVLSVKDALDPSKGASDGSGYTVTTDYTVSTSNGTVTRVSAGAIADGALVNVTYEYVPADYFEPVRLYDFASVESRYGSSLDPSGTTINSVVSYAAGICFENGAGSVVIQPLFARGTPGNPATPKSQPSSTAAAASTTWSDTLFNLRAIEDINVVVPIVGQSMANVGDSNMLAIFQTIQDHIAFMNTQQQYIIGILAEDASTSNTVARDATLKSHASTLQSRYGGTLSEQLVLVTPASFVRPLPGYGTNTLSVGGQYVAAAVAGMLSSQPVSSALTREVIAGFLAINDFPPRTLQDKNADGAAGLFVTEQRANVVRVRHSVTLDNTATARAELSVVRAKHRMIESINDTLENQIIGKIIADGNSPYVVRSAVVSVLEALRQARDLVDYSQVDSRLLSLDPTTIQVTFSYRPAFTLNHIVVSFSLDLTNQVLTVDNTGTSAL